VYYNARGCVPLELRADAPEFCRAAYFTGGERGVRQEQNCIHDFFDFTQPADRVRLFFRLISLGWVHGSFDDASSQSELILSIKTEHEEDWPV
jgi:hypothetical protein